MCGSCVTRWTASLRGSTQWGASCRTGADSSLANSIKKLGYEFEWIKDPSDFEKAEVGLAPPSLSISKACRNADRDRWAQT